MSEEEKNFKIKDRRAFKADGDARDDAPQPEPQAQPEPEPQPEPPTGDDTASQGDAGGSAGFDPGQIPPVDFSGLILSLSHAAMMHMGLIPEPNTGEAQTQLPLARHTIDTIAMLKQKTEGNLEIDEQRLIDNALTELRLGFVRLSQENQEK